MVTPGPVRSSARAPREVRNRRRRARARRGARAQRHARARRPGAGVRRRAPRARRVRVPADVEHPSVADRSHRRCHAAGRRPKSRRRRRFCIAAQDAEWGPLRIDGELHDRASYRHAWTLLPARARRRRDRWRHAQPPTSSRAGTTAATSSSGTMRRFVDPTVQSSRAFHALAVPIAVPTAAAASLAVAAQDYPKLKAGQWEITINAEARPARRRTSRPCAPTTRCRRDMISMGAGMSREMCTKNDFKRDGARLRSALAECKIGDSKIVSRSVMTLTGDTGYHDRDARRPTIRRSWA